jgi:hypothetical protein
MTVSGIYRSVYPHAKIFEIGPLKRHVHYSEKRFWPDLELLILQLERNCPFWKMGYLRN